MKVEIVTDFGFEHHVVHGRALRSGLACHGIDAVMRAPHEPSTADIAVCWGWRLGAPLREAGKRVLVMERGYMGDRSQWTSLGWDGLNGRAEFPRPDEAHRFWRHFAHLMHDVDMQGTYSLVIGQVDGDASLDGVDIHQWYASIAAQAKAVNGLPVRFRPHPISVERGEAAPVDGTETMDGTLADALDGAALVLTWNSTTGVESVLRGKPTVAADKGSMAWPVAAHKVRVQIPLDRERWAERLAWCQWTKDDLRSGFAWDVVKAAL